MDVVREGRKNASGSGVYFFTRNLIVEGKDAWFVNDTGCFAINWERSPMRYADYKSKDKNISKRKASNNLRSALLNFYEKEGAKEYKEGQKKNKKGEIIERQFQMPPRIFEELFGSDLSPSDDGSQQKTDSIVSEVCKSSQDTPNSSDTGFDEAMDISCDDLLIFNMSELDMDFVTSDISTDYSLLDNIKSEEICPEPPDMPTPFQIFGILKEELKEPDEICSKYPHNYNGQEEVVEGISPSAGSVEGGLLFYITLKDELPEDDPSEIYEADFEGVSVVGLAKLDHCTLAGFTPSALVPGPVKVTVKTPEAGQLPGSTSFLYVDRKTQEVLEQLVKDPALQSLYSRLCDRELSIFGSDSSTALNLGPFAVQGQVVDTGQSEDEDKESDYFADAETSSCGSFELEAGWSDSEDGEGPCSKDEGPHKELSERSSSSLEERTSFEIPAVFLSEERIHLEHVVEKDDDEDENCEEHASVNSKTGSALDELPKWLSALQIVDATTSRQQGACVTVDEMHEDQLQPDSDNNDGTYPKNGGSKKELHGRSTSSIDNISNKTPVAEFDTTTAREEGAVGGGTQKRYDTSIRQQEANACPSHEETAKAKTHQLQDCYYYKQMLSIPSPEDAGDQRKFQTNESRSSLTFGKEAFPKIFNVNPGENNMADNVEPTIGLNDKQFKHYLEDVQGEDTYSFLSMEPGEDSQDSLNFGVHNDMRPYGQQYHNISSSQGVADLPSSSSPQPPAYPHNIPYSPGPVASHGNSNTSISPINTTPYDTCSNYSDASTPGTSTTPPPVMAPSYMQMHSHLPTIPSITEYPGNWNFLISFRPLTESASKSATWTYSDVCKKLYVNLASFFPIKFKTTTATPTPPSGTFLRAPPVFKGSTNLHDIVKRRGEKRCPNHMECSKDGSAPNNHFIRSNNPAARNDTCPESSRHSLLLPYNGPQVGAEYVTEMFASMCFSSCASGPSRRPVEVIFTLEKDGQTLGRRVVEIGVCACPGRDRKSDEKIACGEPSSSQGVRRLRKGSNKGPAAKRRRTSSRSQDEEYTITTRNPHVYEILMDMRVKLEEKFESLNLQNPDHSLVLSTSEDEAEQPSTSGSSGAVYKRAGLSNM